MDQNEKTDLSLYMTMKYSAFLNNHYWNSSPKIEEVISIKIFAFVNNNSRIIKHLQQWFLNK